MVAALLICLPWLLYVAVGNLFLNVGGVRLLLGSTNEITVKYRIAWSLWPGRVNLRGFHLTFQDVNVQFALDLEHANVELSLLELPSRTFHAKRLRGGGATFRMRHRIQPNAAQEPWVKALAPIPEFSDPPLFESSVPAPPIPEARYRLWTVHLEDVDVGVSELWVQFIRYRGSARATGAFRLRPARHLWVGSEANPTALQIADGRITLGDDEIVSTLNGRITCVAHPFDVRVPVGLAVLRHISSRIELHGKGVRSENLPRWFAPNSDVRIRSAPGELDVAVDVSHGRGRPGSSVTLSTESVELGLRRARLAARGVRAVSRIVGDGSADSELRLAEGELALRGKRAVGTPLAFRDVSLGAHISRADAADPPHSAARRIKVQWLQLPDARWLNELVRLPDAEFLGGKLQGRLAFEEEAQRFTGKVILDLSQLGVRAATVRVTSTGHVEARLDDASTRSVSGRARVDAKLSEVRLSGRRELEDAPSFEATLSAVRVESKAHRSRQGSLDATVKAEASQVRGAAGKLWFRAKPTLRLSARGERSEQRVEADLELSQLNAGSSGNDDCPWFKTPLTQVKFSSDPTGIDLKARIQSLRFGWGDFRSSADADFNTRLSRAQEETDPAHLSFELRMRNAHLHSGKSDKNGWEVSFPALVWRGEVLLTSKHPGHAELEARRLSGRIGDTRIASRLAAKFQLSELDLERKHSRFSANVELGPADVKTEQRSIKDWWARIRLGSGLVSAGTNLDLSAIFQADLRDATPGVAMLAERDAIPDIIARNLELERLSVTGIVQRRCRLTDFLITRASGGPLSARGRLHSTTDATRAALLLRVNGLEAISAGVSLGPQGSDITPLAGDDWLNESKQRLDTAAREILEAPCPPSPGVCSDAS